MKVAVIGTGAVGGYFGARLAEAGHQVTFLARGQHLDTMLKSGLRVISPKGDVHLQDVDATDQIAKIPTVDLMLLGVKAWQVEDILPGLKSSLTDSTLVLPLQNGVEAPALISAILGKQYALAGLCRIIAERTSPGVITHHSFEPTISLGELDGVVSERVDKLKRIFEEAGIKAETPDDLQLALWKKFLFITAVSGLGGITRATIGEFRSNTITRAMLEELLKEIVAVGRAHSVAFEQDAVDKMLAFIDTLDEAATASMQRDIMEGRPSELEAQTGAVVRLAEVKGVEVPQNRFIYNVLQLMEEKARG